MALTLAAGTILLLPPESSHTRCAFRLSSGSTRFSATLPLARRRLWKANTDGVGVLHQGGVGRERRVVASWTLPCEQS